MKKITDQGQTFDFSKPTHENIEHVVNDITNKFDGFYKENREMMRQLMKNETFKRLKYYFQEASLTFSDNELLQAIEMTDKEAIANSKSFKEISREVMSKLCLIKLEKVLKIIF